MFFLMSDWLRETVEPCLLPAREREVAREMETVSFMAVEGKDVRGDRARRSNFRRNRRAENRTAAA